MTNDCAVTAEAVNGRIFLWADTWRKEAIKTIPGARWHNDRRQWHVPLSWAACLQLRQVFGTQLAVGADLAAWSRHELAERINPCMDLRLAIDAELDVEGLYPFQRAGVRFLIAAQRALCADEMGTGKTVQVSTALSLLSHPFPALIVCPKSIKRTWKRELAKWCPGATVVTADGSAAQRKKAILSGADVVVINYEAAWRHSRLAPYGSIALKDNEKVPKELNEVEWRTVVIDEAHRIKDPKSKQTRAVWWLGRNATYRYALTGTPIANAPDDLWSLMHFVSPEEFPTRTAYIDRYCLQSFDHYGYMKVKGIRPEVKDEFYSVLDPRFRRMPKDLVLPFLPAKTRVVREVEMSPKQRKAYAQMAGTMLAELSDDNVIAETLPFTQRLRLMQFASASAELNDAGQVRLSMPSSKIDEMIDWLEDIGDEPAVVFAQSRQLIDLAAQQLAKKDITYKLIVGGMSEDERANSERDFQEGKVRVLLGTIQAAGEGLTLTRARHLGFLQRSDSMLGNKQSEDRVHRIGSEIHDKVIITDFVAVGTVEEAQIGMLYEKMQRLEEIVRDRSTLEHAAATDPDVRRKLEELDADEAQIMGSAL